MATYKDIDSLIKNLELMEKYQSGERQQGVYGVIDTIKFHPTADVVEVKHGHWIEEDEKEDSWLGRCYVCSVCESCPTMNYRYCPYCGAKMEEVINDA